MDKRLSLVVLLVSTALVPGCYTTRDVPVAQIQLIQRGLHKKELILRTPEGKPVRFGPRSTIRFKLSDERWTPWYRGHQLRVNRQGVCAEKGCQPPRQGWRWEDVRSAQVKNLSGGRTYAAVFVTVAVAVATVAIIAAVASGKGGGGGGKLNLKGLFPRGGRGGRVARGGGRVARGGGRVARGGGGRLSGLRPRGGVRAGGLRPRGPRGPRVTALPPRPGRRGHPHGGTVRVHIPDPGVEVGEVPPPEPTPPEPTPPASTPPTRLTLHDRAGPTSPIFTRRTRRRASIRFIGSVEGGGDLVQRDGGNVQALVGMRILDVLELGLGAHLLVHRGVADDGPHRASWMGVFRLNLHFDLDARRRVALPIGVDVGVGHATIYTRLNLGVRVRLTRHLSLGLYPFNPTYAQFSDDTLKRKLGWWSFPTTLDLSFAL